MNDQAERLRQKMMQKSGLSQHVKKNQAKTLAVVSGKGGVGKTNISVNFAIGLAKLNKKVMLFDMDIGMGNIQHLINGTSSYSIADFFTKNIPLQNLIEKGPEGISVIHGGSAFSQLFEWEDSYKEKWITALDQLVADFDYLIFDMGAGVSKECLSIIEAAEEILTVTTPEPTSMTDAYSMLKFIHLRDREKTLYLLCNRVESEEEGLATAGRLKHTIETFLYTTPVVLGSLPEDALVREAVKAGSPFTILYPKSKISLSFNKIVRDYADAPLEKREATGFITKLRRFFKERKTSQ